MLVPEFGFQILCQSKQGGNICIGTLPCRLQFPPVVYKNSDLKARQTTHEVHSVPRNQLQALLFL